MKFYQSSGTLGDSYLIMLKLLSQEEPVHLKHFVRNGHEYWHESIEALLRLAPCIEKVEFVDEEDPDLPKIPSHFVEEDPEGIQMTWFPTLEFNVENPVETDNPYWVLLTHSGKPLGKGFNSKYFPIPYIEHLLNVPHFRSVVLLGTDPIYKDIRGPRTLNMVGRTSVLEAVRIAAEAEHFFGPEGLLLWAAASHKVRSTGFYTSQRAVDARIIGTPWEPFALLKYCNAGVDSEISC